MNVDLGDADEIKIEWDKIKPAGEREAANIAVCKRGFEACEKLMNAMKDVNDEAEINVCYPDYGAVFGVSIKSQSLGTFAANVTRVMACSFYEDKFLRRYAENNSKEFMANYSNSVMDYEEY